ncbi:recombinase family protein, partial [Rhodococcus rhodochrous]|nr:recombinase family protein [Rhodococcus rhodochrous]
MARTIGAWARHESQHKGQRIAAARKQSALAGRPNGGVRRFGFENDGVTLRLREAAEVAKAADAIIAGVSLRSIVRDLNTRGVPTASGRGKWTSQTLRGILTNPRTAGLSTHHGEIVGKAVWPPMVPEDRWRAVCAILNNPARKTTNGGTIKWLGSGIYVCGVCGSRELRVSAKSDGRRTYRCRNRESEMTTGHVTREAQTLDAYVEQLAVARLSRPDFLEMLSKSVRQLRRGGCDRRGVRRVVAGRGTG